MDGGIVSAMAGVLGALVGGAATFSTAWVTQRAAGKRQVIEAEISKREALYGEFIEQCSKLTIDAVAHDLRTPDTVLPLYALVNRIRLSASDKVLAEAEHMLRFILKQYFSPNLSVEEIRTLALSGTDTDPLKSFGEACRAELESMRATV